MDDDLARQLPRLARRLYALIAGRARAGEPAPSTNDMSAALGASVESVALAARRLLDQGLIAQDYAPGTRRRRFHVVELDLWTGYVEPRASRGHPPARTTRPCITGCGAEFRSDGPHHRMCNVCRRRSVVATASIPSDGRARRRGASDG